jgi:hypothetical protein
MIQEYIGAYTSDEHGRLVFKHGVLVEAMLQAALWNRNRRRNRNFLTNGTGTVINYGSGTGTRYNIMYFITFI